MAKWWQARSQKRKGLPDHTRVTLLEDDADDLEGRIEALEKKEDQRQVRDGKEAVYGGMVRMVGLAIAGGAGAVIAALIKGR